MKKQIKVGLCKIMMCNIIDVEDKSTAILERMKEQLLAARGAYYSFNR